MYSVRGERYGEFGAEDWKAERVGEELPLKLDDLEVLPACKYLPLTDIFGTDMAACEINLLLSAVESVRLSITIIPEICGHRRLDGGILTFYFSNVFLAYRNLSSDEDPMTLNPALNTLIMAPR